MAHTDTSSLSLHDALPISACGLSDDFLPALALVCLAFSRMSLSNARKGQANQRQRAEEHTSELQSLMNLVCRVLLEKTNSRDHDRPAAVRRRHQRRHPNAH